MKIDVQGQNDFVLNFARQHPEGFNSHDDVLRLSFISAFGSGSILHLKAAVIRLYKKKILKRTGRGVQSDPFKYHLTP